MFYSSAAWVLCIFMLGIFSIKAWAMWLAAHPPCTREEFEKMVKQLNQLTMDMGAVVQTADSMRTAVGMSRLGVVQK